jgi:hypothetical protein
MFHQQIDSVAGVSALAVRAMLAREEESCIIQNQVVGVRGKV